MKTKTTAFKVGIFVLVGIILITAGIVFLGVGGWKKKYIFIETYIDESVQGLEVGAPVKYRGVEIGIVHRIDFVDRKYEEVDNWESREVLIEMGIYPEIFEDLSDSEIHTRLQTEAKKGLRVKLKSQGLTGLAYIEADYLDPDKFPPMDISWKPEYCYVPYTPSLSAQLQESADSINVILKNLKNVDLGEVVQGLNTAIATVQNGLEKWRVGELLEEAIALVGALKTTNNLLQETIVNAEVDGVGNQIKDAADTLTRSIEDLDLKSLRSQASDSFVEFRHAIQRLSGILNKEEIDLLAENLSTSLTSIKRILENSEGKVDESMEALRQSSVNLSGTTKKLNRMLSNEQANVELIFENMATITADLRELTQYIKKYPSHVLFGEPPTHTDLTR